MTELEAIQRAIRWHRLRIEGTADRIDRLIEEIDRSLPAGWIHDHEMERELREDSLATLPGYLYRYLNPGQTSGVSLWLSRARPDALQGGQTVPLGSARFQYVESERYVASFMDQVLESAAERVGLRLGSIPPAERAFDRDTFERLSEFATHTIKTSPLDRSEDIERWNAFLTAAHRAKNVATLEEFKDWLRGQGFSEDQVDDLGQRYHLGLSLLQSYDTESALTCR